VSCLLRRFFGWVLSGLLLACTPALNWREVRPELGDLTLLMPCKPDRASKTVPLGGQATRLVMVGCEAAGAMFVLSVADLGESSRVGEVLMQWQALTLTHMRAAQPQQRSDLVSGADRQHPALRVSAKGQSPEGKPVEGQALFFARGSHVFQAVIYSPRPMPEAVETFFASIKLL
jgi:hypothetical protein